MAYSAITTPEVAVDAPVSNPLMTKVKDNFDYLKALEPRLPKAFAKYLVSGDTLDNKYNFASITRTGVGDYTALFTTALPSDKYEVVITCAPNNDSTLVMAYATSLATTGFNIACNQTFPSAPFTFPKYDPLDMSIEVFQNS